MPRADVWFQGNDMIVGLSRFRSSTMASGSFIQNSTGLHYKIWAALTTDSTAQMVTQGNLPYSNSSGRYQVRVESTVHSMRHGTAGFALITAQHGPLNGEWRPLFLVGLRRSS